MSKYQRATVEWQGGFSEAIVPFWFSDADVVKQATSLLPAVPASATVTSRQMLNRFDDMMHKRSVSRGQP